MARKKTRGLSHGRPPLNQKPPAELSSKATKDLIRSHHQLQKVRNRALQNGDSEKAAKFDEQIASKGGLKSYQHASILGQSPVRGGDSSKVLMEWLSDLSVDFSKNEKLKSCKKYKMLEIGALSTRNACSRSQLLSITRIDLHAQMPGIEQQDFMARPLPDTDEDKFDIISLSLVLNYCSEPISRGAMLQRTCQFLRLPKSTKDAMQKPVQSHPEDGNEPFPCLFLVLPAPCVCNSRYLTEPLLTEIMQSLGFTLRRQKTSAKLVYYLWGLQRAPTGSISDPRPGCTKQEVNPGKHRNNFSILLKTPT